MSKLNEEEPNGKNTSYHWPESHLDWPTFTGKLMPHWKLSPHLRSTTDKTREECESILEHSPLTLCCYFK